MARGTRFIASGIRGIGPGARGIPSCSFFFGSGALTCSGQCWIAEAIYVDLRRDVCWNNGLGWFLWLLYSLRLILFWRSSSPIWSHQRFAFAFLVFESFRAFYVSSYYLYLWLICFSWKINGLRWFVPGAKRLLEKLTIAWFWECMMKNPFGHGFPSSRPALHQGHRQALR